MPVLLFKLNGVPDDEAEDVRRLLQKENIPFYETSAGNWRISMAAIWLNDSSRFEQARKLIEVYQEERAANARTDYYKSQEQGSQPSFLTCVRREPVRYFFYLLIILVVMYFSTIPFYNFTDWLHHG